jgi:mono/diheme cytochrome c family protein
MRGLAILAGFLIAAGAIAQPYTPTPPGLKAPAPAAAAALSGGEALFVAKCGMCHRRMGMGTLLLSRRGSPDTAELEKRKDLTRDYIVQAARSGIGNMPRISRGEVDDVQLGAIASYLANGATR